MNERTEGHIVRRFDGELAGLRLLMLEMGGLVLDQVQRAVASIEREDLHAAREVIARDHLVNSYDSRIDEASVSLLARRQPMAGDLRVIMAIGKAVSDLERIGDEAKKIARMTLLLFARGASVPRRPLLRDVRPMAALATRMLGSALRAFDEMDADAALVVTEGDAELDREFRSASRRLSTYIMEDSRQLGHAINVLTAIKALERFYKFERALPLGDATKCLRALELALELEELDSLDAKDRSSVESYNRDDCLSTLQLRDWLESLRSSVIAQGTEIPRPELATSEPTERLDARLQRTVHDSRQSESEQSTLPIVQTANRMPLPR